MELQQLRTYDDAGNVAASLDVPVFSVIVSVQVPRGKVVEPELVLLGQAALEAVMPHPKAQSIARGLERQPVTPNVDLVIVRLSSIVPQPRAVE